MIFVGAQTQGSLISVSFPHDPQVTSLDVGGGLNYELRASWPGDECRLPADSSQAFFLPLQ